MVHAILFPMLRVFIILFALFPTVVAAQDFPYADIPHNAWYRSAVQEFLDQNYLDSSQENFRAADSATRAEFTKLILKMNGGVLDELPEKPSFSDVATSDWFYPYVEEAARERWMRGDGDCLGVLPCYVRPHDSISRSEASALINRAFAKKKLGKASGFADNPPGQWFSDIIQAAADHCILRGDTGTRNVRPHDPVNRAEMVVMLKRVEEGRVFPGC